MATGDSGSPSTPQAVRNVGKRGRPSAKRAPALPPIKPRCAAGDGRGGVFADHYRLASAIRAPMIAAAVPGSSIPEPRGGTGRHVRRKGQMTDV